MNAVCLSSLPTVQSLIECNVNDKDSAIYSYCEDLKESCIQLQHMRMCADEEDVPAIDEIMNLVTNLYRDLRNIRLESLALQCQKGGEA